MIPTMNNQDKVTCVRTTDWVPQPSREVETYVITLRLDRRQATDLYAMCGQIGGNPYYTTRGVFDDIKNALHAYAITGEGAQIEKGGAIYFTGSCDSQSTVG